MNVAIVGIGLHPFGRFEGRSALQMGAFATRQALADAGIGWSDVQIAFGGSLGVVLPDSHGDTMPDSLVTELGLTGLPFVNVANGCATAGTALLMAASAIESGAQDVAVAVGFDKHPRGHFNADPEVHGLPSWYGEMGMFVTTQFFAMKIQRYMHDHGITPQTLARVAAKNFRNGAKNPNAWRQKPFSEEEILASRMLNHPLTQYMFCSPDEGAAAVVLCRADRAHEYTDTPVFLKGAALRSRRFGTFEVFSPWLAAEQTPAPTTDAAAAVFEQAGIGPSDVDVAQVQDSEAGAEIIHMAETGLCEHGQQEELIARGATEIDGALPINTDGGLIANGEPIAASGMRQVIEIVTQLRGHAGDRQVPNEPQVGFTQVYGAPGVSACTVLTR
jgi:acetyl-CoA acetyltransferase